MLFVSIYLKHLRLLVLSYFHMIYVSIVQSVCKSFEPINCLVGIKVLLLTRSAISLKEMCKF